jgi:hypothetical protein
MGRHLTLSPYIGGIVLEGGVSDGVGDGDPRGEQRAQVLDVAAQAEIEGNV